VLLLIAHRASRCGDTFEYWHHTVSVVFVDWEWSGV